MIVQSFRENMIKAGINPPSEINADGKFHRFSTNGKPSDDAGWYILNEFPIAGGSYGCWRTGLKGSWYLDDEKKLTQEEKTKFKQAIQRMIRVYDEEKAKVNQEASLITLLARSLEVFLDAAKILLFFDFCLENN